MTEPLHRALTLLLIVGTLYLLGASLFPLDAGKRQAIAFGLAASFVIRSIYVLFSKGWGAAENAANAEGEIGIMASTVVVAGLIALLP